LLRLLDDQRLKAGIVYEGTSSCGIAILKTESEAYQTARKDESDSITRALRVFAINLFATDIKLFIPLCLKRTSLLAQARDSARNFKGRISCRLDQAGFRFASAATFDTKRKSSPTARSESDKEREARKWISALLFVAEASEMN